jgi:hypothetical protein
MLVYLYFCILQVVPTIINYAISDGLVDAYILLESNYSSYGAKKPLRYVKKFMFKSSSADTLTPSTCP